MMPMLYLFWHCLFHLPLYNLLEDISQVTRLNITVLYKIVWKIVPSFIAESGTSKTFLLNEITARQQIIRLIVVNIISCWHVFQNVDKE